jgi:hypothetical protein
MSGRMLTRWAIEVLILYASSAVGPIIYARDRSLFDTWELVSLILLPTVYALAGLVVYDVRVRPIGRGSKKARRYGWYFGGLVFLMAVFQAVYTVLISPGGPEVPRRYVPGLCAVYALAVAALDFQAWKTLREDGAGS